MSVADSYLLLKSCVHLQLCFLTGFRQVSVEMSNKIYYGGQLMGTCL